MKIVGCDLHTRYQQIAMLDQETGELVERRLGQQPESANYMFDGLRCRREHDLERGSQLHL